MSYVYIYTHRSEVTVRQLRRKYTISGYTVTNCRTLIHCMFVSYIVGHERAFSLLFQCVSCLLLSHAVA
jgi:hypothetical protein